MVVVTIFTHKYSPLWKDIFRIGTNSAPTPLDGSNTFVTHLKSP